MRSSSARVGLLPPPNSQTISSLSCCQRSVIDALDGTAAMGSIATLALLSIGFGMGFTIAWLVFG